MDRAEFERHFGDFDSRKLSSPLDDVVLYVEGKSLDKYLWRCQQCQSGSVRLEVQSVATLHVGICPEHGMEWLSMPKRQDVRLIRAVCIDCEEFGRGDGDVRRELADSYYVPSEIENL